MLVALFCSVARCLWKLRCSSLPTSGPWMIVSVAIRQQSTTESDRWCGSGWFIFYATAVSYEFSGFHSTEKVIKLMKTPGFRRPNQCQHQRVLFTSIGLQVFVLFCCLFRLVIQHTSDVCVAVLAHSSAAVELKTNGFNLIPGTCCGMCVAFGPFCLLIPPQKPNSVAFRQIGRFSTKQVTSVWLYKKRKKKKVTSVEA